VLSRKIFKVGLIGLLAVLLLVLPLVTACAGEKPTTVKIGYLADLTGPYAAAGKPLVQAFEDYFEMVNDEGGIDGVPVEVIVIDTQAKADLSVTGYKRLKAEGVLALSCMVTPVALAVQALLNEDKIPGINQSATMSLYIPPTDYMWCHGVIATDYDLAVLYWFDNELWDHDKWGDWTLGILAHDNPFALGGTPAMYKYADTYGVKLVQPEVVALTTLDFSTSIQRLVDAGANAIFIETLGAATGTCLKQMGEMGVLGTVEEAGTQEGKIVPLVGATSYLPAQLVTAHDEAAYTYGALPLATPYEEDISPTVKEANDFMRAKYGHILGPEEGGTAYQDGWNNGLVILKAIERALESVSWEELTGETLVEYGLKGLEFDPEGFGCDRSYADYEGDRIAIQSYRVAKWDMELWDRVAISDCLNIPELLGEMRTTNYMTTQGGSGWYTP
jgi:ABC-type branched-subunit amino acid transport system substrate-binding protein